jgi:uncharacterized membrane protein (UPF0182 family)
MPELSRVIVSIGNQVVMDKTLQNALQRLKAIFINGSNASPSGISTTEVK